MAVPYDRNRICPLDGVRILDLSRLIAGNILTHVLADMGADVIKVEPPGGDSLRAWKLKGHEVQWKVYGRNKRSIVINLKNKDDRQIFRRLVASAHMLVENYRPGVLDRLGFHLKTLHTLQPGLVVVRISGWGTTGPYRNRPGFGTLVEAASGFAYKNGFPDREPLLPNLGLADSVTGLYGAALSMIALREAEREGGRGQEIDLSLFDCFLSILGADQAVHAVTGEIAMRNGNRSSLAAPRNVYRTRDDEYIALSASTPEMAARVFDAIGEPELIRDPRFATNTLRVQNVEALDEIVAAFIARRTLAENLAHFEAADVTVGPIYDPVAVMSDPHVIVRQSFVEMEDEDLGSLPMHAVPGRLSTTPGAIRRPAPRLDEHRRELLEELGFSAG